MMPMPARSAANACIARVARIITNQFHRMTGYLNLSHDSATHPQDWVLMWDLFLPYNRVQEES